MTDILDKVFAKLKLIAPAYLAEAESDDYPFIVYDAEVEPVYVKSDTAAIASYKASVTIASVSDNADEALANRAAIASKMAEIADNTHSVRLQKTYQQCTEGIWVFYSEYTLTQKII